MQIVAVRMMGLVLSFMMTHSAFAGDQRSVPAKVQWVFATMGETRIQLPLVPGLSFVTADLKNNIRLSTERVKREAEIRDLRSMANVEGDLELFSFTLMIGKTCESGVDLPLCHYAVVPPAKKASVSWIQLIHRSDLGPTLKRLRLREAGEMPPGGALYPSVVLLQQDQGHPYHCPPDRKFGSCRMYMKLGDDLLGSMMLWREEQMSDGTPFAKIADAMGKTIARLIKD